MSISSAKQNVFTTIGAYTSLKQETKLPDMTNLFPSVNNKKDVVPFLLDILKTVVGSQALKELTGKLFTDFIDGVEPKAKEILTNQMTQYNSGNALPSYFQSTGAGITIPVKDIDVYKKFGSSPTSPEGSLLYDTSRVTFDKKIYDAILNGNAVYNNLNIAYNNTTDSVTLKSVGTAGTIGEWMGDYINDVVIIDKKEFLTNTMNAIYGSVSKAQGKSIEQTYEELQISKLIQQLINDDDSFVISEADYDELLRKAQELVDGVVYYDMGCGVIGAELPLDGMTDLISQISGSTDSFFVGNAVDDTIAASTVDSADTTAENVQTISDGFFQRLINAISLALSQAMTTSPQIRALLGITSAFQNNGAVQIGSAKDDLKKFKVFLKCIIKDMMKLIAEFIFNLILVNLISLINPIIRKILKEKINQYIGIIKALII